jgi:hypothetical protein
MEIHDAKEATGKSKYGFVHDRGFKFITNMTDFEDLCYQRTVKNNHQCDFIPTSLNRILAFHEKNRLVIPSFFDCCFRSGEKAGNSAIG